MTAQQQTKQIINSLCEFESSMNEATFVRVFGEFPGRHLWMKFAGYKFNVLNFYRSLDYENSVKFIEFLNA